MVSYNPRDWFRLIVQFHKSDTFRILIPTMSLLGLITFVICFVEKKFLDIEVPTLTIFHQVSGFVISMVLVFRINTAYDRWWEGRRFWGSLVNNCRNLAIKLNVMLPEEDKGARRELFIMISDFPFVLKEHLRNNDNYDDVKFSKQVTHEGFSNASHKPAYLANRLTAYCLSICKKNIHTTNDYLVLSENLNQLMDICGGCERIKRTPIPYSYGIFIKKIIFIYIITMPIAFGLTIGYWAVPIVMIMFYAFASLELISEEIEDPFGTDSNDLPTDEMSVRIKENIREILLPDEA